MATFSVPGADDLHTVSYACPSQIVRRVSRCHSLTPTWPRFEHHSHNSRVYSRQICLGVHAPNDRPTISAWVTQQPTFTRVNTSMKEKQIYQGQITNRPKLKHPEIDLRWELRVENLPVNWSIVTVLFLEPLVGRFEVAIP